jgi:hypothetical protein
MPSDAIEPPFISGMNHSTSSEPPTFDTTAERLRWRADRIGPFGLGYISAAELRRIADELDPPDAH